MASVNKVILIGNLGKDPEARYAPSGDAVSNFVIATSESWKDKATGEKKEQTEWHRCSVFGKLAEICNEYLKKGSPVYVEGSLHTRKWTDKEGQDRYTTEVKVTSMKMLGSKPESGSGSGDGYGQQPTRGSSGATSQPASSGAHRPSFDDLGDDIPF